MSLKKYAFLYRKHVLLAGAAGLTLGVLFALASLFIQPNRQEALISTLWGVALNAAALAAISKALPEEFPDRGTLLEALLAQLLLFFSAWAAAYNLLS
ncbi:MAG: hypothetical protein N3F67_04400 [Acidilobaceae archaeon]|nr:hypothetical protein [Acidilobaceae archaeon]